MTKLFVIHTMGKVGSRSVLDMFARYMRTKLRTEEPIVALHTHYLRFPNRPQDKKSKEYLESRSDEFEWTYAVSIVRDPIARNVSAYFQNRHEFNGGLTTKDFIEKYRHSIPLDYMYTEFSEYWNIGDVSVGVRKYNERRLSVLVVTMGNLSQIPKILEKETGIRFPEMKRVGANASNEYREFKQGLEIPSWYLDTMIQSKYAYNFFTKAEREEWEHKWKKE